jgi:hypothetical protein
MRWFSLAKKKWTYETIKEYIEGPEGNGCKLLTSPCDDINTESILEIQCKCGNVFNTKFRNFNAKIKPKKQCNECGKLIRISKTRTPYEKIKYFIEVESNSGCKLLSKEYKSYNDKMLIQCKCGNTFFASMHQFKIKNKRQCDECSGRKRWDYESVKKFVEENSECKLISTSYKHCDEKLTFQCKCGKIFKTTFTHFKENYGKREGQKQCPECGIKKQKLKKRKPYEKVKEEIESNGCKLLTPQNEYKGTQYKVKVKCKCGDIFECSPNTMKMYNKYQCNKCSGKQKLTLKEVKEWIKHNAPGYEFLSKKYKGVDYKYEMKCPKGHIFSKRFGHFYHGGDRCPVCISSSGENAIVEYLTKHNIEFKRQYSFPNCKRVQVLHFDFAVFNQGELYCLIEFDGQQHFEPCGFGSSEEEALEKFRIQKECDEIKNKYCKDNNILLIRIPYWELQNIEMILNKHLMKEGVLKNAI